MTWLITILAVTFVIRLLRIIYDTGFEMGYDDGLEEAEILYERGEKDGFDIRLKTDLVKVEDPK